MPRSLSFDPQEKLHQAMLLFWRRGYHETSVSTLTQELDVNKFSLYKQFGDKHALFNAVLEHYYRRVYRPLLQPLHASLGKPSLEAYFENFSLQVAKPMGASGCLLSNTLTWGYDTPSDSLALAKKMVSELRTLLKRNFQVASTEGQLCLPVNECVNFTMMSIQGLLNTRRSLGPLVMQNNLRFFVNQMEQW